MDEKKKIRSIDFLTPEQLRRKRESDRNNARLARDQKRAYIQNLELRVRHLEQLNYELEQKLAACHCRDVRYSLASALPSNRTKKARMTALEDGNWQRPLTSEETIASTVTGDWTGQVFDAELLQLLANPSLDDSKDIVNQVTAGDPASMQLEPVSIVHCEIPELADGDSTSLSSCPVWCTTPKHIAPTCRLDQVVADLIQSRRSYELTGGNIPEFQERPFPSIPSLLNPIKEADRSPVTSSIVTNIIRVMTVPAVESNLPEQIAILYFMSSVIRWQISPTEANYNSMPAWLRPTPSQIAVPHPIWLDLIVWPNARERLCRDSRYYSQNAIMTEISNESISVNWPYGPSNVLMQENGSDVVLNPAFAAHIKNLDNWSLGPRILEVCVVAHGLYFSMR
ncbi:uncharacterized protein PV09_09531 [Verruconis gallopava]|uniref:BZIP domain-containing protein n=1 Tax=Verruconis gallopava TaxID=253628 RepID=A0A0D1ZXB8_9PEZI|nr:uncharacterized protein PV09_09531 [Verruconis gallopava]KIV98704.1 hypothetical protein PV09_09531 [Verruconis gallopava]